MEKYTPTVSLFFDTRIEKKSGKYPLKLTVYCKPKKKRYKTKIDLSEEDWLKLKSGNIRDKNIKEIKIKVNALTTDAEKIINNLFPFSFIGFEKAFYENATDLSSLDLKLLFDAYILKHTQNGNIGTAISYQTSFKSLDKFHKNLTLTDITPQFLKEYEEYMIANSKSPSTVGIYLRQLRAVFNDAISQKIISNDCYPFGKNKYVIPVSKNIKKALSNEDLQLLFNYESVNSEEQRALDFWKFSYLCSGMNFCDILRLKPENIKEDFIYYIRSKTKNTKKGSQQQIKVAIIDVAKKILEKWKSKTTGSFYIFPFLKEGLTPLQEKYYIQDFIKKTNQQMDSIRNSLGITQKCNTYSCRHSFATFLKRKNVSTEYISESLGHSSILTTSAYLASFEDKTKVEYSNLLIDF